MKDIKQEFLGDRRQGRRWIFGQAVLDEDTWSLTLSGERVTLEGKPLIALHELLLNAGRIVSKEQLLDVVWPGVLVVEASLSTAIYKLRKALDDRNPDAPIIETLPRMGYRLTVPVVIEAAEGRAADAADTGGQDKRSDGALAGIRFGHPRLLVAGLVAVVLLVAGTLVFLDRQPASQASFDQRQVRRALRELDVKAIEKMLQVGWDPNAPLDAEGNGALNTLLLVCEWDRGHDKRKLLLMARTLNEGGAKVDAHNVWGDTSYSIARSPRYCGPSHPVTVMLEGQCFNGPKHIGDSCLPRYNQPNSVKNAR